MGLGLKLFLHPPPAGPWPAGKRFPGRKGFFKGEIGAGGPEVWVRRRR